MKKVILLLLVLSGCATTGKLEDHMKARVGQDINDVIGQIGPPSDTFKLPNGSTMYSWMHSGETHHEGRNNFGKTEVVSYQDFCKITYTADASNKIIGWRHEGNTCISK